MIRATSNAESIIKGLLRYMKDLKSKERELLLRLHRLGVDTANLKLEYAEYPGEMDAAAEIEPRWEGETKLILAVKGKTIAFIEFGTGVTYYGGSYSHPIAGSVPYSERGTYGKRQGMLPTWIYPDNGTGTSPEYATWELKDSKGNPTGMYMTRGNPANRVVYETGKEIKAQVIRIAKEVVGSG